MIKPEWGAKRQCPKCNTRFYDLGNDDPVTCISCGNVWVPEPLLKSKQPLAFEAAKPDAEKKGSDDGDIADDDLDLADDSDEAPDDDTDIGGDDEIDEVVDQESDEEN